MINPKDVIWERGLNFNLRNVVKYVERAGNKPGAPAIEDLEKAKTYLEFEIATRRKHEEKEVEETEN